MKAQIQELIEAADGFLNAITATEADIQRDYGMLGLHNFRRLESALRQAKKSQITKREQVTRVAAMLARGGRLGRLRKLCEEQKRISANTLSSALDEIESLYRDDALSLKKALNNGSANSAPKPRPIAKPQGGGEQST